MVRSICPDSSLIVATEDGGGRGSAIVSNPKVNLEGYSLFNDSLVGWVGAGPPSRAWDLYSCTGAALGVMFCCRRLEILNF